MTKLKITRRLRRWQRVLLLHTWKIKIVFDPPPDEEDDARAGLYANPEYREAIVYWDSARVDIDTDDELDAWCIHELLHAWTWPLEKLAERSAGDDAHRYEDVREVAETTVTNLEQVVKAVWLAGQKRAR